MPELRLVPDTELPIETDWFALHRTLSTHIVAELANVSAPRILEAGCGRRWSLHLSDIKPYIVGLDVDEAALRLRLKEQKDLDEFLVCDLRSADLPPKSFDVVYCSYVLEHIDDATAVLRKMLTWIRPNGLLVIKIPLGDTAFGFLTRVTPLWLHVLYHRYMLGIPDAGKPGRSPYPVFYDSVVSLRGMQSFLDDNNLRIVFVTATEFPAVQNKVLQVIARCVTTIVSAASLGRLRSRFSGLALIAQKRG